jgi:hypothetical protein
MRLFECWRPASGASIFFLTDRPCVRMVYFGTCGRVALEGGGRSSLFGLIGCQGGTGLPSRQDISQALSPQRRSELPHSTDLVAPVHTRPDVSGVETLSRRSLFFLRILWLVVLECSLWRFSSREICYETYICIASAFTGGVVCSACPAESTGRTHTSCCQETSSSPSTEPSRESCAPGASRCCAEHAVKVATQQNRKGERIGSPFFC